MWKVGFISGVLGVRTEASDFVVGFRARGPDLEIRVRAIVRVMPQPPERCLGEFSGVTALPNR